jgi:hypothetical protein
MTITANSVISADAEIRPLNWRRLWWGWLVPLSWYRNQGRNISYCIYTYLEEMEEDSLHQLSDRAPILGGEQRASQGTAFEAIRLWSMVSQ